MWRLLGRLRGRGGGRRGRDQHISTIRVRPPVNLLLHRAGRYSYFGGKIRGFPFRLAGMPLWQLLPSFLTAKLGYVEGYT